MAKSWYALVAVFVLVGVIALFVIAGAMSGESLENRSGLPTYLGGHYPCIDGRPLVQNAEGSPIGSCSGGLPTPFLLSSPTPG